MLSKAEQNLNDPITQHMRTNFAQININQTVGEALDAIRKKPPKGRIVYFYVVDDENCLKGVIPTRRLLLNSPERLLRDIMMKDVIALSDKTTVYEACTFFVNHRFLALPVIDDKNRLVGIIDVELYTDELRDLDQKSADEELFQLIGVHLIDAQQASSFRAFYKRFPWLVANICGGILAAFLSGVYKTELQNAVALALFIPVVLALAESVSIQSVSLSIQTLHGKKPTVRDIYVKLRSEFLTGLFLGIASASTVALVGFLWLGEIKIVLCLLGGIAGGVFCAAIIGVFIPYMIRYFNREPHVASGPLSLAFTDIVTLFIYFSLARWLS